ncbi:MAG: Flagellar hook protein FlgE [Pelotomaculum thermopropionicum]|uniref:Flagellar hook protein FlgE n=1 Tax=Pelotomaculum thermopropionicum TaxID=110500 RepID=A0A117M2L8_9FIRM|nr:MAG: Flagellar hook protein FlgE [Pelotomaculum thermopropionicum]
MLRGLYSAASGMDVQQEKIETLAKNLANAATPGYKKDVVQAQSFPELLLIQQGGPQRRAVTHAAARKIGFMPSGTGIEKVFTEYTGSGGVKETRNPTDMMLKGPGFFAVNVPTREDPGRVCYTRNGAFKVDEEGYLVAFGNLHVLGEAGPVRVGDGDFKVNHDGTVVSGGMPQGKLRLVEFDDLEVLNKETDSIFVDTTGEAGRQADVTTVRQGFLEVSNVDAVKEVTALMEMMRVYETSQRLIIQQDQLLGKAVNQVGSLR